MFDVIFYIDSKLKWDAALFGDHDACKNLNELRPYILSFDEHAQHVVKVASFVGNSFSLPTQMHGRRNF